MILLETSPKVFKHAFFPRLCWERSLACRKTRHQSPAMCNLFCRWCDEGQVCTSPWFQTYFDSFSPDLLALRNWATKTHSTLLFLSSGYHSRVNFFCNPNNKMVWRWSRGYSKNYRIQLRTPLQSFVPSGKGGRRDIWPLIRFSAR